MNFLLLMGMLYLIFRNIRKDGTAFLPPKGEDGPIPPGADPKVIGSGSGGEGED
jgi:hypothetical protein